MKRIYLILSLLVTISFAKGQSWNSVGEGLNGNVHALTVYNGSLVAGGDFTNDGSGLVSVSRIAAWNGANWEPLSSGLDGKVKAMVVLSGKLYAAGEFTHAGTTLVNRIAMWNGSSWTQVGDGFNGTVNALHVFNGVLYAGGSFTYSGTTAISKISKFDGNTWQPISTGLTGGNVNSITDYNSQLYAAGSFTGYVAKFDGNQWNNIGGTINAAQVDCIQAWGPNGATSGTNYYLYASGDINGPSQGVIRYNGTSWSSAVNQFNSANKPRTLFPTGSYIFAGGSFDVTIANHQVKSIAKFNNQYWDSVGTGMDDEVLAFTYFNNELISAGKFTTANSQPRKHIARYAMSVGINEISDLVSESSFYPNPVTSIARLNFDTKQPLENPLVQLFDASGREVNAPQIINNTSDASKYQVTFDKATLEAGIYFFSVTDNRRKILSGKFIAQ